MASRTMLAASFDDKQLLDLETALYANSIQFPLLASPKIDGIRFTVIGSEAQSRSGKRLPNNYFQSMFASGSLNYLDGEVVVGMNPSCTDTTGGTLFNRTQSAIMTSNGMPEISLHVFDYIRYPDEAFCNRTDRAKGLVNALGIPNVSYVDHTTLDNPKQVLAYEEEALLAGYEGIMLRHPRAPYKFGRSTLKQQGLIKVKRFKDDEAIITGFVALERNTNPITKDAYGLSKRSSHKSGKIPDDLLGKLLVKHPTYGEFAIGSGFDVDTRKEIWQNQNKYLAKTVAFKFQPHGTMNAPRAPIFKGFRYE